GNRGEGALEATLGEVANALPTQRAAADQVGNVQAVTLRTNPVARVLIDVHQPVGEVAGRATGHLRVVVRLELRRNNAEAATGLLGGLQLRTSVLDEVLAQRLGAGLGLRLRLRLVVTQRLESLELRLGLLRTLDLGVKLLDGSLDLVNEGKFLVAQVPAGSLRTVQDGKRASLRLAALLLQSSHQAISSHLLDDLEKAP